jgi:hypothetical protein
MSVLVNVDQNQRLLEVEFIYWESLSSVAADWSTLTIGGKRLIKRPMTPREAAKRTFAWTSLRRSLFVALVVGTALNIINQGSEMLSGNWPVVWKLMLTYLVPFLVASYGSYAAFRSIR